MSDGTRDLSQYVDLIDLKNALQSAPSLFQEVGDQNVGSYAVENFVRARFLNAAAIKVLALIVPTPSPSPLSTGLKALGEPITFSTVSGLITDCGPTISALKCVGDLATLQAAIEKTQVTHDSCKFAKGAWLPPYTRLTRVFGGGALTPGGNLLPTASSSMPSTVPPVIDLRVGPAATAIPTTLIDGVRMLERIDVGSPPGC
jgi:hypothetical protein